MILLEKLDIRPVGANGNKIRWGRFFCLLCGNEVEKDISNGLSNKSCGCILPITTHGFSHDPIYNVWAGMHDRCNSPKNRNFHRYGGRGIMVCPEWKGVEGFAEWARNNGYQPGLQLDRKDNDGNYKPDNCRFTTSTVNMRNSSNTKLREVEVVAIRAVLRLTSISRHVLAKMFGVTETTIRDIKCRRSWVDI